MADAESMSTLDHERTLSHLNTMSALLPRADIGTTAGCHVVQSTRRRRRDLLLPRCYCAPMRSSKNLPTLQMGQGCRPIVARRASREALWVFSLGSFHESITGLQCRIPLQHPPFATLTILATAVGNRQLGKTHNVPCPAMLTSKVNVMAKLAAHPCTICDSTPR
jgi:hypothetical protein